MKIQTLIIVLLLFFSCKKSTDGAIKLLRTESIDNAGNVLHTTYGYDGSDRISSIVLST